LRGEVSEMVERSEELLLAEIRTILNEAVTAKEQSKELYLIAAIYPQDIEDVARKIFSKAQPIIEKQVLDRRLDRPKLREKIAESEFELTKHLAHEHEFTMTAYTWKELEPRFREYYYYRADKILALIPTEEEIKKLARWEVGEELCCLIGNKMLEDMEAGKLLGKQLEEYMKNYLKG